MSVFKNKNTFNYREQVLSGNAVLNGFLETDIKECIFSCDEKKQDDMRHEFQVKMPGSIE